jgi:hypothetical protein
VPTGESATRPPQVTLALLLFAVGLFLAPIRGALRAHWDRPVSSAILVLLLFGVAVLWVYGLHRRKRWLWWVTVISLAIGVAGMRWDLARQGAGLQLALYYVQCATAVPAVVLLCLTPARRWFHVSAA